MATKLYQTIDNLISGEVKLNDKIKNLSSELLPKIESNDADITYISGRVGEWTSDESLYSQLTGAISARTANDEAISGRLDNIDKAISGYSTENAVSSKFESVETRIKSLEDNGGNHSLSGITASGAMAVSEYADHTQQIGLTINANDKFLSQSADGLSATVGFKKVTTGLGDTIAAQYYLTDKDGNQVGDAIDIEKDRFLKSAEFVEGSGSGDDKLKFTFNTLSGTDDVVEVPLTGLFNEYSEGAGIALTATDTGIKISGVVDPASESGFFTLGENGFKVAGIQTAIDTAVSTSQTTVQGNIDSITAEISGAFAEGSYVIVSKADGIITSDYQIGDSLLSSGLSGDYAGSSSKLVTSEQLVNYVNNGLDTLLANIQDLVSKI